MKRRTTTYSVSNFRTDVANMGSGVSCQKQKPHLGKIVRQTFFVNGIRHRKMCWMQLQNSF